MLEDLLDQYGTELGNPAGSADIAPLNGYGPLWYWTGTEDAAHPNAEFMFFGAFDGVWLID